MPDPLQQAREQPVRARRVPGVGGAVPRARDLEADEGDVVAAPALGPDGELGAVAVEAGDDDDGGDRAVCGGAGGELVVDGDGVAFVGEAVVVRNEDLVDGRVLPNLTLESALQLRIECHEDDYAHWKPRLAAILHFFHASFCFTDRGAGKRAMRYTADDRLADISNSSATSPCIQIVFGSLLFFASVVGGLGEDLQFSRFGYKCLGVYVPVVWLLHAALKWLAGCWRMTAATNLGHFVDNGLKILGCAEHEGIYSHGCLLSLADLQ
jgi:hypothetical protein